MNDQRPDADELLERLTEREHQETRARFKIFFGASAGVGKTFAMLSEARERRQAGVEVVAGVVETHGRPETAQLLDGLEQLPQRPVEYRGVTLREFDIDAALARRPRLLLVDELAHTNAPGSRHVKRWQDVEELLAAGIDVHTTLNVQHVDSLNDVVAQVTGVTVRETVPDSMLDRADEIELVDISPDDLMQRLREGKVYLGEQASRALGSFFKKGNLLALRELALRKTADRVDAQLESHRRLEGISKTWDVRERLLVCVGDPETGLALVREARRMAVGMRADWLVVHVERPGELRTDPATREKIVDLLSFAEELGAQTTVLSGHSVSDELLAFARERHVSRILVGKPTRGRLAELIAGSLTNTLIRSSGEIDVYVVDTQRTEAPPIRWELSGDRSPPRDYVRALVVVLVATGIAALMAPHFDRANLVMLYLIAVLVSAVRFGRGPAVMASLLSVAAFDFFFVPPFLTFAVSDTQYLVTFAVMLGSALLVSTLGVRLREQAEEARQRERRTAALFALSRDLADTRNETELLEAAAARARETLDAEAVLLLPDHQGHVHPRTAPRMLGGQEPRESGVAQWVFDHAQPAGYGTDTLPSARGMYIPLQTPRGVLGVLGLYPVHGRSFPTPRGSMRTIETFANQIALALERSQLATDSDRARLAAESERMRNALLSSVSHDLRTPLAAITGATTSLLRDWERLSPDVRRELLQSASDEAARLNRVVANLLEMTRLEAGVNVRKEWQSIEEVVGTALARMEELLRDRRVELEIRPDLPLVAFDAVSVEQVLINLIENALKYSSPDLPITIRADAGPGELVVEVLDRGPGIPTGQEELVFEKFFRGDPKGGATGMGLGLAICRAIVSAHGGSIQAASRSGGGTVVRFTLPRRDPPIVEPDAEREAAPAQGSGSGSGSGSGAAPSSSATDGAATRAPDVNDAPAPLPRSGGTA